MTHTISALVDRFLQWPLPKTVSSDLCVTDLGYKHPRFGTNLLTAAEARQMIEYLLPDAVDKRNSKGWFDDPEFRNIRLVDPDGWDRSRFAESWCELITRDEFRKRLAASTIVGMSDIEKRCIEAACRFERLPRKERIEMREKQRRSWVVGETLLAHPEMTREQAEALYDKVLAG